MTSIVICARNAERHLRRTLPAVVAIDYPKERLELLVVDNGSRDGTAALAHRYGARVISHKIPGVAGARDVGWRAARGEFIAFLDSDCIPPLDWLRRIMVIMDRDADLGAVGCRLVTASIESLAEEHIDAQRIVDTDHFWTCNDLQFPFLVTACLVLRRSALESVGGFSREFGRAAGEDADLCIRLMRQGWGLHYERDIVVRHYHRASLRAMLRQTMWYGEGQATIFARWQRELGWHLYVDATPYQLIGRTFLAFLPALFNPRRCSTYQRLRPVLELMTGCAFLLGKYRGSLRNRVFFV